MNGWAVFAGLVLAYAAFYYVAGIRKALPGFDPAGPLLLWKTQAGVRIMDRLARHRRFWSAFGDLGIAATVAMALLMFGLLVLQLVAFATDPVRVAKASPPPITLVGLPGVNPIIPLWYGIAGLVVALVVHEGCHGVLARLAGMRVKSTGLLFLVVPIGAFVEPDESDLERSKLRHRNRVFAAGPWSNLLVAVVAGAVFSGVFMAALAPPVGAGVTITQVSPASPADAAGFAAGDVLVGVAGPLLGNATANATAPSESSENPTNGSLAVRNQEDFVFAMNRTSANATYTFSVLREGTAVELRATLRDRHDRLVSEGRLAPEWTRGKGDLGVTSLDNGFLRGLRNALADPLEGGAGFAVFFFYPLFVFTSGVDILNAPFSQYYTIEGPLSALGPTAFFVAANAIYWIFWLNLMLGTFNSLPAGPLDGGQLFRASLREALWRRLGVDRSRIALEPGPNDRGLTARGLDAETQAKLDRAQDLLRRTTLTLGLFILGLILLPLLGPSIVTIFAP